MYKKIAPITMALACVCPSISFAAYKDVPISNYAYHWIEQLSGKQIISGYSDGSFKPGAVITRKQAAMMLVRTLALSADQTLEIKDVNENTYGYKEIVAAVSAGLFNLKDGLFQPDEPLTREDMAKALAIGFSLKGDQMSTFVDVPKTYPYYRYIDALAANNITTGYSDQSFQPKGAVNRGQFAAFIGRTLANPREYEVLIDGEKKTTFRSKQEAILFAEPYDNAVIRPVSNQYQTFPNEFLSPEKSGVKNGVLLYNGYEIEKNPLYNSLQNKEFFKPYLAYKENGQYVDSMFDSLILLGREYPGGEFTESSQNKAGYSEWLWYLNKLFGENGTISIIGQSIQDIPVLDHVNIFIAIPYPQRKDPIVDLNGQTHPNTLDERFQWTKWYIDQVYSQWRNKSHNGLVLKGFYWLNETVTNTDDEQLLLMVSDYIHQQKGKFIYSPHALSTNFENWQSYGFDGAYLQSNAHFMNLSEEETKAKLHNSLIEAQTRNSGVNLEIENHGYATVDIGLDKFRQYLHYADLYGASSQSLIMYQGASMVNRLATYNNPLYQEMYTELYHFLKNK
ncbi:MAG: DUF4855 domain-containing protein [Bacillales bacterium]|nr:DUF4855 domain-containing protein [Bacillales bacterium]